MIVLGLTGSIGMGKTVAARNFARLGVPVFEADAVVHELLGPAGAAVAPVGAAFSGTVRGGAVDRAALGDRVFGDGPALRRLEAIVHPLVAERRRCFLAAAKARRAALVALDIPLLFETGMARECDYVAVVSAPVAVQRARVLARPGMTEAKLAAILNQQIPDARQATARGFRDPDRRRPHAVVASHPRHRHNPRRWTGAGPAPSRGVPSPAVEAQRASACAEVALDTETTGLDPDDGHRIVEIGCVELDDHVPTGREWRALINPERDVPAEAYHVHGLSEEALRAQPRFR